MDVPSPDFPQSSSSKVPPSLRSLPVTDSGYAGSSAGRRPSEENYRRRPSEDAYGNRSEDGGYGSGRRPSEDSYARDPFASPVGSTRRKPSQDTVTTLKNEERRRQSPDIVPTPRRPSDDIDRDRELARKPSGSVSTTSDSTTSATNAQREMIIPNKSTIAEEEIEVPYGRERESTSTAIGDRLSRSPDVRDRSPDRRPDTDGEGLTDAEPSSARSAPLEIGGLSGLSARLRDRNGEEDDEDGWSGQNRSGEEYYDKMSFGRASVASDRSSSALTTSRTAGNGNTGRLSKSVGNGDDVEALRREYEFKIATMQNRLAGLERELEDAEERERRMREAAGEEKMNALENEVKKLREVR